MRHPRVPAVVLVLALGGPAPASEPLAARIDRLIAAGHPQYATAAAPLADDAEFLRRVTLDLAGTIPTAAETRAFLADADPKKREKRIDELLAAPGYARRMADVFDVTFMERRPDKKVPRAAWEEYLRTAFAQNVPYDQLAREILSADGDPKNRAPAKFLLDRDLEPNLVTRDVARVFLGRDLRCAQCHDHPIVDDYKQEHYFGILAFLNRSYLFPNATAATAVIAEKADGEVTFTSVFDPSKATKATGPKLLDGKPITEPKPEKGKEYTVAPAKDVRPVPAFSRRAQLAAAVVGPDNPLFARTAANRLWATFLGRGLVHPVDLDHSDNPPSHPELLDLLAREFVGHEFDVRWLVREIVRTDTYQRSSAVPGSFGTEEPPADRYLVAVLKPLTPEQLAHSAAQATGRTDVERAALGAKVTDAALAAKLAPVVAGFRRALAGPPGEPQDGFTATLGQTLFLKYGAVVRGLFDARPGSLPDRLAKAPDPNAAADELFLSVFTRRPTAEERADVTPALTAAGKDPTALAEVAWALIASAEFRFNH